MTAPMKVTSVNVGHPSAVAVGARPVTSGIDKRPVAGRIRVGRLGLDGDHILNTRHHGGLGQAVYAYMAEDHDAWAQELGDVPPPGQFGENLLIRGLRSAELRVGDCLDIRAPDGEGGVRLEVTAPRIPCATFAAFVGDPGFVKRFARAGRPGAYLRVLVEGDVAAGDTVTLIRAPEGAPTLLELFRLWYDDAPDPARLAAFLEHPLSERLRINVQERLNDLR